MADDSETPVVLTTVRNPGEGPAILLELQAAGIEAWIEGESVAHNAIEMPVDTSINVMSGDADAAVEVLREFREEVAARRAEDPERIGGAENARGFTKLSRLIVIYGILLPFAIGVVIRVSFIVLDLAGFFS